MTKQRPERIADNYVSLVKESLVSEHHMTSAKAEAIVRGSNLHSCICGCPYIANHYPAAKAASMLAAKNGWEYKGSSITGTAAIHHTTY